MSRSRRHDDATPGHDSFLDIVSNIVGILIILVMVTGVRAKNYTPSADDDVARAELDAARRQLETQRSAVGSRQSELVALNRQVDELDSAAEVHDRQRMAMVSAAESLRRKIADRREQLDASARAQFDLDRQMAAATTELETLGGVKHQLEAAEPDVVVVETPPTPLSKTVRGDEVHFRLSNGYLVWIPMPRLLEELKSDARGRASELLSLPELTNTVGPYGGFRLRYTLQRKQISTELAMARGLGGQYAELQRWTLIPTSNTLGETVDEALGPDSEFRRRIASLPRHTAITIWTYEDSFASFRRIKKELYALGFATSGRPLPHGVPIQGSPTGTRSAAQ